MLFNTVILTWGVSACLMLLAYFHQRWCQDASYVDVVWSASIGLMSLVLFIKFGNYDTRHILLLLCPLFWSIRLTMHLLQRLHYLGAEDSRYRTMRQHMGDKAEFGFFLFFQVQALFVVIFILPIAAAFSSVATTWQWYDTLGTMIFVFAFLGEALADRQLLQHRKEYGSNVTCQSGLWYYSRHPNYFFEWLHWFAYSLFAFGSAYFWLAAVMPFIMLIFLLKLTGVPYTEMQALKSKPDYKQYQETTSMFIPLPKRQPPK